MVTNFISFTTSAESMAGAIFECTMPTKKCTKWTCDVIHMGFRTSREFLSPIFSLSRKIIFLFWWVGRGSCDVGRQKWMKWGKSFKKKLTLARLNAAAGRSHGNLERERNQIDAAILPEMRILYRARSVSTKLSEFRADCDLGKNEKTQQVENDSDSDATKINICCDGRCEPLWA